MKQLTISEFQECESTNDEAWRLIEKGTAPVLVIAERQLKGRGRQGRGWEGGEGGNILVSLAAAAPSKNLSWLSLGAGVAAVEAIERAAEILRPVDLSRLRLKWPNDLYWGDRKLGGILCESRISGEKAHSVVVGFGLNLISAPALPDVKTANLLNDAIINQSLPQATIAALRLLLIHEWSLRTLAWLEELDTGNTADLRNAWLRNARLEQYSQMKVHDRSGQMVNITALDLDENGRLKASAGSTTIFLDQPDSI